jgi:hypothetical protein
MTSHSVRRGATSDCQSALQASVDEFRSKSVVSGDTCVMIALTSETQQWHADSCVTDPEPSIVMAQAHQSSKQGSLAT